MTNHCPPNMIPASVQGFDIDKSLLETRPFYEGEENLIEVSQTDFILSDHISHKDIPIRGAQRQTLEVPVKIEADDPLCLPVYPDMTHIAEVCILKEPVKAVPVTDLMGHFQHFFQLQVPHGFPEVMIVLLIIVGHPDKLKSLHQLSGGVRLRHQTAPLF